MATNTGPNGEAPSLLQHYQVLICGAGPVGLLTALALGRAGVSTLVIERQQILPHTTRAAIYMPTVLAALYHIGILPLVKETAYLNREGIYWRDAQGNELGHVSLPTTVERHSIDGDPDGEYVLALGQARFAKLLLAEIDKLGGVVKVQFGMECDGVEPDVIEEAVQGSDSRRAIARVMVTDRVSGDNVFYTADWMMGTDGANSSVRRMLSIPFDGFSYNEFRMVGTDVLYDFKKHCFGTTFNFIVDPQDWAVIVYTGEDEEGNPYGTAPPVWRVAYSESAALDGSPEAIMARAKERVKYYAAAGAEPQIKRAEPYKLRQRCARIPGKGRVLLAGDALHTNNPIGGLGLTNGIIDAFAFSNVLVRNLIHGEPDNLVLECAQARRDLWVKTTNTVSIQNLDRLMSTTKEHATARESFFNMLNTDPNIPAKFRANMELMVGETFRYGQRSNA